VKVAFGLKAHSGWAALVVVGGSGKNLQVVDRRRIDLVEDDGSEWVRQPYHAAEGLPAEEARALVERGVAAARSGALGALAAAIERTRQSGHAIAGCAVLVGAPMPAWSVAEILAVHFRMHKAEGALYRDVLVEAARAARLAVVTLPEKRLKEEAQAALGQPVAALTGTVAALGKAVGPPWGQDQKDAALAAMVALGTGGGRARQASWSRPAS
jgi:hypothetical protein